MLISLWLKYNAGHRGFKLQFTSDEPTICAGKLNGDSGTIESPKNASTYYCEYQRDAIGRSFLGEGTTTGTMGIYISETQPTSSLYCILISPIQVQYLPSTRNRVFTKPCNVTQYPPIASPFTELKIIAKKGGYHSEVVSPTVSSYTERYIDYD